MLRASITLTTVTEPQLAAVSSHPGIFAKAKPLADAQTAYTNNFFAIYCVLLVGVLLRIPAGLKCKRKLALGWHIDRAQFVEYGQKCIWLFLPISTRGWRVAY